MLGKPEYREVGSFIIDHQDPGPGGIINHWGEYTPVFACQSCGALVWSKEKHDLSHTSTMIGLGL